MSTNASGLVRHWIYGALLSLVVVVAAGLVTVFFDEPIQLGPAELNEPLTFPRTQAEIERRKELEAEAQRRIEAFIASGYLKKQLRSDFLHAYFKATAFAIVVVLFVAFAKKRSRGWIATLLLPHAFVSSLLLISLFD